MTNIFLVHEHILVMVNVVVDRILDPDPEGFAHFAMNLVVPFESGSDGQGDFEDGSGHGLKVPLHVHRWNLMS